MSAYAVIDANGLIINRVVLENAANWTPPAGQTIQLEPNTGYAIGGTILSGSYTPPAGPPLQPPAPITTVLSQDLMAQFTVADYTAITAATQATPEFGLMWVQLQAQKDPMILTNARFLAGWAALTQVLGAPRMAAIATALNIAVG